MQQEQNNLFFSPFKDEDTENEFWTIPDEVGIHEIKDYNYYSSHRIKQYLNDNLGMHLVCIRGYKEGRYAGYKQHYELRENGTNKVINPWIYLDEIRRIFARNEVPLHADPLEGIIPKGRNKGAYLFLEAINSIINGKGGDA